jgi:hypothetical protein
MYSMSNRNSVEQKKPQKRRAYSGENVRISRTGGVAVTKTFKKDGVGATLNTKQGLRLHKRLFQGARMGLQNGNSYPDWEEKAFGNVTRFINGKAYKQAELLDEGKYRVLRVGNLFSNNENLISRS